MYAAAAAASITAAAAASERMASAEGREEDGGCGFSESLSGCDEWLWAGPAPLDEWDGAAGGAPDLVGEDLVEGDVVCEEAMGDGDGDEYPHYHYDDDDDDEDDSECDENVMADAGNPWRWTRRGLCGNAGAGAERAWE